MYQVLLIQRCTPFLDAWQNSVTTQAEENDEWDEFLNNDNIIKDSEKDN